MLFVVRFVFTVQLVWVVGEMVKTQVVASDRLVLSLLKQVEGELTGGCNDFPGAVLSCIQKDTWGDLPQEKFSI